MHFLTLQRGVTVILVVFSALAAAVNAVAEPRAALAGWSWGPLLPERRTAFGCCATNDSIITVGGTFWTTPDSGIPEKQWLSRVDCLHLASSKWKSLPDLPVPIDYALVLFSKGRVYAIGGQNSHGPLTDTHWMTLDEPPNHWRQGPILPRALSRLRGGISGSVIVAVTDEYSTADAADGPRGPRVIAWDTNEPNGQWREITRTPEPEIGFRAAAVVRDNLFIFGGASTPGNQHLQLTDKVWRYDLSGKEWRACAPLPTPMRDTTAVALNDRYFAIAGGVEEAVDATSAADHEPRILLSTRCLVYDSIDDKFLVSEPLRLATADHGMTVLRGQLFVVGGEDSPYRTRTDLIQTCPVESLIEAAIRGNRRTSGKAATNSSAANGHLSTAVKSK